MGKLPAGTEASFLLMLKPDSGGSAFVQAGQAVVLPITGKLGGREIPGDSVLVGTLKRLDEKSGVFEFDRLVLGIRVYEVKLTSESVQGRLMQDPKALQAMMSDMKGLTSGFPSVEEQQKQLDEGNARAAAAAVPAIMSGFDPFGGLLSGITGVVQGASAKQQQAEGEAKGAAMTARMNEAMKKLASTMSQTELFAEITPLQSLKLKFREAVDLNTPVATLSAPMKAQGILTLSPDAHSGGTATLAAPGAQPQQHLKPTTPVPPNVNP